VLFDAKVWVPGHFPGVSVGVGEVAAVAAPEGIGGGFEQGCPGSQGLGNSGVGFRLLATLWARVKPPKRERSAGRRASSARESEG